MSEFSRRDFLHSVGGALLAAGLPSVAAGYQATSDRRGSVDLIDRSAVGLAATIREGHASSEEIVRAFLDRLGQVNPLINAVVKLDARRALESARAADQALARGDPLGPLHGVPMTVKDSYDTAGIVSTAGTPGRSSHVPNRDATVISRLKTAGAIVIGKTNTPEMTMSFETDNAVYGRTNNPYDVDLTPGGSSGGAAAALSASCSPLDTGSDTGGSIRLPAHFCGIAGLKPTAGRVPRTGHIISFEGPLQALTQVGPLARYVEDLSLSLGIIAGPDGIDPYVVPVTQQDPSTVRIAELRLAYFTDNGIASPSAEIVSTVEAAVKAMANAVAHIEEAIPAGIEETGELLDALLTGDGLAWLKRILESSGTLEGGSLYTWIDSNAPLPAQEYSMLIERWDRFNSQLLRFWRDYDVLICPVNARTAIPHGTTNLPDYTYTMTYNLTGWPAAVVRCGATPAGIPIGVQVVAPPWREHVCLAVADYLEQEFGGWRRALA